ncbi:MAG: gluconate 2-dehydrogenase subunit 3 family protein [Gammaproteobacteria bacterium]|nr:gluconate 2-dehydrogenase subunit 3 family protein [Gammaproteobacteria bacterium]
MRKKFIRKLFRQWDESLPEGLQYRAELRQSRRYFLKAVSIIPAAVLVAGCDNSSSVSTTNASQASLSEQAPWNTFSSVQNHLFPEDTQSPGADDINATGYLKSILELPDFDDADKKFMHDGVGWINDISIEMFKHSFHQLNNSNKEEVLQSIVTSNAGDRWLSLILLYIFEALIADPVYGGNTNKVGWQWLEHIPGFPLPPENKRYYLLK